MLLTQNPSQINFSRHRRHPASIAVVPTGTPGLLTLSKPPARLPPRQTIRPQSPRRPPRSRIHHPPIQDHPPNQPRGRPTIPKPPIQHRSSSQASHPSDTPFPVQSVTVPTSSESLTLAAQPSGRLARSRRTRHKSTPTASLLVHDTSPERTKSTRAPSVAHPSHSSAPIPVPDRHHNTSPPHKLLSRSDPLSKLTIHTNLAASTPKRKDKRRKNRAKRNLDGVLPLAEWDFPAPGSSDEAEGEEDDDDEPATPVAQTGANDKTWQRALSDGPRTAPLQSAQGQFPFFQFPLRSTLPRAKTPAATVPAPQTPPRKYDHRRAPSQPATLGRVHTSPEGIFHLSEDETDILPKDANVREKMALLFGTSRGVSNSSTTPLYPLTPSPPPRKTQRPSRERESVHTDSASRQLFASSSFQLAPEPVELPKPSFLLSVRA